MSMTLAIDGSLSCSGFAVFHDRELMFLSNFKTKTCKATPEEDDRLIAIYDYFDMQIQFHGIDRIVMEAQYVGNNKKTAMILSRLRGLIIALAHKHGMKIVTYPPSTVKQCVCGEGRGNADKFEVYEAIRALYGGDPQVDALLPEGGCIDKGPNKNDDMSDALAVAHTDLVYNQ